MNEVLNGKIESKREELESYLRVQDMLNNKMAAKVNAALHEQELEATTQAATTQACSSTCDDETPEEMDVGSPASTGSAGHPHRLEPAGHLVRRLEL